MLHDLLHTLSGFGIPIPIDLEDADGPVEWGGENVRWVYDPTAMEDGFVLRLYAKLPGAAGDKVDIAFTPSAQIARALVDGCVLHPGDALDWLRVNADALG
jgi:hypothetical protein